MKNLFGILVFLTIVGCALGFYFYPDITTSILVASGVLFLASLVGILARGFYEEIVEPELRLWKESKKGE